MEQNNNSAPTTAPHIFYNVKKKLYPYRVHILNCKPIFNILSHITIVCYMAYNINIICIFKCTDNHFFRNILPWY